LVPFGKYREMHRNAARALSSRCRRIRHAIPVHTVAVWRAAGQPHDPGLPGGHRIRIVHGVARQGESKMMDWIPVVFIAFKVIVLGTGMFLAVKWHHDQAKKGKGAETRKVLRTGAAVAAVFVLLALGMVFFTFTFARWLGMDLNMS
jgi:hypothetical protein